MTWRQSVAPVFSAWTGRLARERYGEDAVIVGFGGGSGQVIAAPQWGGAMAVMDVPAPRTGSLEVMLGDALPRPAIFVFPRERHPDWLREVLGHRAIGVVYNPARERGNYVPTVLGRRYDAFCWLPETSALRPLHLEAARRGELETYPSGA